MLTCAGAPPVEPAPPGITPAAPEDNPWADRQVAANDDYEYQAAPAATSGARTRVPRWAPPTRER